MSSTYLEHLSRMFDVLFVLLHERPFILRRQCSLRREARGRLAISLGLDTDASWDVSWVALSFPRPISESSWSTSPVLSKKAGFKLRCRSGGQALSDPNVGTPNGRVV